MQAHGHARCRGAAAQGDAQRHEDQQRAVRRGDTKAAGGRRSGHGDARTGGARLRRRNPLRGELRGGGQPGGGQGGAEPEHLLGVRGGVPEGDRARADGGGGIDAGQQLLYAGVRAVDAVSGRLHHGGQVLQDPFSPAQSGAHPLPDRAGEGYAEEDERHERHRAGLLDEVQREVTAIRCWQGVRKDILHAL